MASPEGHYRKLGDVQREMKNLAKVIARSEAGRGRKVPAEDGHSHKAFKSSPFDSPTRPQTDQAAMCGVRDHEMQEAAPLVPAPPGRTTTNQGHTATGRPSSAPSVGATTSAVPAPVLPGPQPLRCLQQQQGHHRHHSPIALALKAPSPLAAASLRSGNGGLKPRRGQLAELQQQQQQQVTAEELAVRFPVTPVTQVTAEELAVRFPVTPVSWQWLVATTDEEAEYLAATATAMEAARIAAGGTAAGTPREPIQQQQPHQMVVTQGGPGGQGFAAAAAAAGFEQQLQQYTSLASAGADPMVMEAVEKCLSEGLGGQPIATAGGDGGVSNDQQQPPTLAPAVDNTSSSAAWQPPQHHRQVLQQPQLAMAGSAGQDFVMGFVAAGMAIPPSSMELLQQQQLAGGQATGAVLGMGEGEGAAHQLCQGQPFMPQPAAADGAVVWDSCSCQELVECVLESVSMDPHINYANVKGWAFRFCPANGIIAGALDGYSSLNKAKSSCVWTITRSSHLRPGIAAVECVVQLEHSLGTVMAELSADPDSQLLQLCIRASAKPAQKLQQCASSQEKQKAKKKLLARAELLLYAALAGCLLWLLRGRQRKGWGIFEKLSPGGGVALQSETAGRMMREQLQALRGML